MSAQRLKFRIVSSSGEDSEFPVHELLSHSQNSRGWQSPRFCEQPQHIILQFFAPIRIKQIQFLSHQSKISSKIELFTFCPDRENISMPVTPIKPNLLKYKRLGQLSLDSNERSGFQARELKSVYVDTMSLYLKILFNKCHINQYNLFNQVGLVALNILGDSSMHDISPRIGQQLGQLKPPGSASSELNMIDEMKLDPLTADRLKSLMQAKFKAVECEDFEEAKRLKIVIDKLKAAGGQLKELEERKIISVKQEDQDAAKLYKIEIERIRNSIQQSSGKENQQAVQHKSINMSQNQIPQQTPQQNQESLPRTANSKVNVPIGQMTNQNYNQTKHSSRPMTQDISNNVDDNLNNDTNKDQNNMQENDRPIKAAENPTHLQDNATFQTNNPFDETPIPTLLNKNKNKNNEIDEYQQKPTDDNIDSLSEEAQKIIGILEPVFPLEALQQCFSKKWNLKEKGLDEIQELLDDESSIIQNNDDTKVWKSIILLCRKTIDDKVAQIQIKTILLLNKFLNTFKDVINSVPKDNEYRINCTEICSFLLLHASGNNPRCKENAEILFKDLIKVCPEYSNEILRKPLLKKQSNNFKLIVTKLNLMGQSINQCGIDNNESLESSEICDFSLKQLIDSPNAEVRSSALYCLLELYVCNNNNDNIIKQHNAYKKIRSQHVDMLFQGQSMINNDNMTPEQCVEHILNASKKNPQTRNVKAKTDNSEPVSSIDFNRKNVNSRTPDQNQLKTPEPVLFQCSFCNKKDKSFNEEGLDLHFWKECPMLCQCSQCDQVIEVSTLSDHLLTECAGGTKFSKCGICKFVFPNDELYRHKQEGCAKSKSINEANQCPLCFLNIPPGEQGWIKHLVINGCKNHDRSPI